MARIVAQPGARFGLASRPSAPVITGAVDGGDQASAVISIVGTDTIRLFYRLLGSVAGFTTGLTRIGSGDITQTGLTAGQWYEFYCKADAEPGLSDPSNLVTLLILASTATIEKAIYSLLSGDPTLSALVGTRIDPMIVPQGTAMPAVTYMQIPSWRDNTLDGPSGLVRSRWQINCWALTTAEARTVSNAVRQAIAGYSGSGTGVVIQAIMAPDLEIDIMANPAGKDVARRYGKTQDFEIWFCEAA
ncbi:MAG TPA: DUF3168 domain-containing protein [Phycisphaerales bacterium]|nr:DUF3168 domain-containing protein [Phycisphaerales bacterium]